MNFFRLISKKQPGELLADSEILAATGWQQSTLETHRGKNALAPFLDYLGGGSNRVLRDGTRLSEDEVGAAFTQIRRAGLTLGPGQALKGRDSSYELLSEIGRGAVAHVWRAKRKLGSAVFAAKILNPRPDLLDPKVFGDVSRRFAREAENGQKLSHEHVVRYVDRGTLAEHPFLVMEIADETLASALGRGPVPLEQAVAVVRDCAHGLQYLHSFKSVHRDVKPHNILRFGQRYVLGDLGVVKWSDMNPAFASAGTMTRASLQLGSWYYMAPEQQVAAHSATEASDIYALGVSWLEMLTGSTSHPATIAAQEFPDPSADAPTNELIRRMLRYRAGDRPTATEVLGFASR